MFRVVPFRKLSDICGCFVDLRTLYLNRFRSNKILIQDTDDMIIEEYTIDELRGMEKEYDVLFEGFDFDTATEDYYFYINKLYFASCECLNKKLKLEFDNNSKKYKNFINTSNGSSYTLSLSYLNHSFEFTYSMYWIRYYTGVQILFCNGNPFLVLGVGIFNIDCCFELIQICKTNSGFELVIFFPTMRVYLGIRLDNNLNLIGFENLDYFKDYCLSIDANFKEVKSYIARHKLLNDWSDILV